MKLSKNNAIINKKKKGVAETQFFFGTRCKRLRKEEILQAFSSNKFKKLQMHKERKAALKNGRKYTGRAF